ncbi:PTS IIA-like nitrogen regulatory protein PtsN [Azovibrio restrictus]|uniref:PTS IIA-like nitrogen regulatory protein PtsN n=1 Tax=Azovibrio restrictus TaxID=146938 RepID=UPI0026EAECA7|nr:PTS IIA-like nitrogen regulatory protein PtsN [Azovibrio restrictus]MDD3482283.1 PTS IIA-like nitrogen regulatory protein PtsN [Azovibrio restrictus]
MNLIAQLLPESHVLLGLEAGSKKRVFEQAGQLFETSCGISQTLVFDSLFAREKLGSTGLGQGIAIPHGRIKGLKQATGAFIRLAEAIAFDAPDGRPVAQLFVLLVPEQATEEHLQILSELATRFADRPFREKLAVAPDAVTVRQLFSA